MSEVANQRKGGEDGVYVNKLSEDKFEVDGDGKHKFKSLYYDEAFDAQGKAQGNFYHFDGVGYRKIKTYTDKKTGELFIYARNTENKRVKIDFSKIKGLYDLVKRMNSILEGI
jgi:hypothetical protein